MRRRKKEPMRDGIIIRISEPLAQQIRKHMGPLDSWNAGIKKALADANALRLEKDN